MTSESEQSSSDPSFDNEADPRPKNTQDGPTGTEGNPEVLRWRADSLLDEMMLGAIDVSAADISGSLSSAFDREDAIGRADVSGDGRGNSLHGSDFRPSDNGDSVSSGAEPFSYGTSGDLGGKDGGDLAQLNSERLGRNGFEKDDGASSAPAPTPEWRVKSGGGSSRGDDSVWDDYVSTYRPPNSASGQIQKWQPENPADGYANGGYQGKDDGRAARDAHPPATDNESASVSGETAAQGGTGYVSAMAVMPRGPRRSSLLPRMSRFDVDALEREIADLHAEIRALLPVEHDQAERARHLLDKAHSIVQSDPERSAEVEYYMQQVRTIVERTRQTRRWSNLYRDRLRIYLVAWTLLAGLVLSALLLFQFQIEAYVGSIFSLADDGVLMRNFTGALGSMMAGALGGALGALYNMQRHARTEHSFFDRKYGLRGVMLPIIGALVGTVIFAVFAMVYYFVGINPALSAVAMGLPALAAFIFGFSQESIYGTNG